MKDWLGQEIEVGDTVIYGGAGSGRSIQMVLAKVVKFNDSGSVTVLGIRGSRWKQHHTPSWYIDSRTSEKIDWWLPEHKVSGGNYRFEDGTLSDWNCRKKRHSGTYVYGDEAWRALGPDRVEMGTYQRRILKDYVTEVFGSVKPVTLTVTENITKWTGEVPDED